MGVGVVLVAATGVLLGPLLAGLSRELPTRWPPLTVGLLRGRPAGPRRIAIVTALTAAVLAVLVSRLPTMAAWPAYVVVAAAGVVLAVIDVEHHRLPDRLVGPTFVAATALLLLAALVDQDLPAWLRAMGAAAAVSGALLLAVLVSPGGLGLGDVKLGGVVGLMLGWLGWGYVPTGLFAGFVLGAVHALVLIASRRATLRTPVAFGPALLAGALLAVVIGPVLITG